MFAQLIDGWISQSFLFLRSACKSIIFSQSIDFPCWVFFLIRWCSFMLLSRVDVSFEFLCWGWSFIMLIIWCKIIAWFLYDFWPNTRCNILYMVIISYAIPVNQGWSPLTFLRFWYYCMFLTTNRGFCIPTYKKEKKKKTMGFLRTCS